MRNLSDVIDQILALELNDIGLEYDLKKIKDGLGFVAPEAIRWEWQKTQDVLIDHRNHPKAEQIKAIWNGIVQSRRHSKVDMEDEDA